MLCISSSDDCSFYINYHLMGCIIVMWEHLICLRVIKEIKDNCMCVGVCVLTPVHFACVFLQQYLTFILSFLSMFIMIIICHSPCVMFSLIYIYICVLYVWVCVSHRNVAADAESLLPKRRTVSSLSWQPKGLLSGTPTVGVPPQKRVLPMLLSLTQTGVFLITVPAPCMC